MGCLCYEGRDRKEREFHFGIHLGLHLNFHLWVYFSFHFSHHSRFTCGISCHIIVLRPRLKLHGWPWLSHAAFVFKTWVLCVGGRVVSPRT